MRTEHLAMQDLPDDILSYIFDELALVDPPGLARQLYVEGRITYEYTLGRITATHVCRRWRILIFSLPPLWAAIICRLPLAFETLLERARSAPLTLDIMPQRGTNSEWLTRAHEVAFDRIENVRVLHCTLHRAGPLLDRARHALTRSTLHLLVELDIPSFSREEKGEHITPEKALDLDAPNLRVASLHGLRCNFTSTQLRSLEFFHYEGAIDSTGHFLQVLRNTPLLENLRCSIDCLPFIEGDLHLNPDEGPARLVHLKRLCAWRHAYARNVAPDAATFFRNLYIPTTCVFHYRDITDGPQIGWQGAFETCSDRLRQLPYDALSIHILSLDEEGDFIRIDMFFMHECTSPLGRQLAPDLDWQCCTSSIGHRSSSLQSPSVRLQIDGLDEELWRAEDILPKIMSQIQSDFIVHLALDDVNDRTEADVIAISLFLRRLNAVTTLFVRFNVNGPGAMLALATAAGYDNPVLPNLRDLIIEQVYHLEDDWGDEKLNQWWMKAIVVLERRKETSSPVHTLRLTGRWMDAPLPAFDRSVEGNLIERARLLVDVLFDERIW